MSIVSFLQATNPAMATELTNERLATTRIIVDLELALEQERTKRQRKQEQLKEARETGSARIADLEEQVDRDGGAIKSLHTELDRGYARRDEQAGRITELEDKVATAEKVAREVKDQYHDRRDALVDSNSKVGKLSVTVRNLKAEVEAAKDALALEEGLREIDQKDIETQVASVVELRAEVANLRDDLEYAEMAYGVAQNKHVQELQALDDELSERKLQRDAAFREAGIDEEPSWMGMVGLGVALGKAATMVGDLQAEVARLENGLDLHGRCFDTCQRKHDISLSCDCGYHNIIARTEGS